MPLSVSANLSHYQFHLFQNNRGLTSTIFTRSWSKLFSLISVSDCGSGSHLLSKFNIIVNGHLIVQTCVLDVCNGQFSGHWYWMGCALVECGDLDFVSSKWCWLCALYWEQSVLHVSILINLHHFTIKWVYFITFLSYFYKPYIFIKLKVQGRWMPK